MGPIVSCIGLMGMVRYLEDSPAVGLIPTTLNFSAGKRILPEVSDPKLAHASSKALPTALPDGFPTDPDLQYKHRMSDHLSHSSQLEW